MLTNGNQTTKKYFYTSKMRWYVSFCLFLTTGVFYAQTPEETAKKLTDLYGVAHIKEEQLAKDVASVKLQREKAEEELKDATDDKDISAETLKAKKKNLTTLLQKQKILLLEQRDNKKLLAKIGDLINEDAEKQSKFLSDYEEKYGAIDLPKTSIYDGVLAPVISTKTVDEVAQSKNSMTKMENNDPAKETQTLTENISTENDKEKPKKKKEKKLGEKKIVKITALEYDEKNDVTIHPPSPPCRMAFDSTDTFTGKRKKESAPTLFFTQTDDVLKKMMQDKEFITCYATITRIQGGISYLNMNFIIQSKETQKVFGFLDKGSPISFRLMNGRTLNFTNDKTDIGTVDFLKNTTTYQASVQLYSNDIKALTASELDQVRVAWSAGSDDYEIYDLNVLKNLLKCVE